MNNESIINIITSGISTCLCLWITFEVLNPFEDNNSDDY